MGKAVKGIGGIAKSVVSPLGILGGGLLSKDALFGQDLGTLSADPIAKDVRRLQLKGLQTQEKALSQIEEQGADLPQIVKTQTNQAQKRVRSGFEDARRALQSQIARRGLGQSSLGLGAIGGLERKQFADLDQIRASELPLLRAMQEQQTNRLFGTGTNILQSQNAPIRFNDESLGRSQGLLPGLMSIPGAIFGGKAGGAEGAKMGGQAGYQTGGALSNTFGR